MPIAIIPRSGSPTPVVKKPAADWIKFLPDICPRYAGNIKLPAPKKSPKSIEAIKI